MILASYDGDLTLERLAVEENGDLFEEVFGFKPVFRQKKEGMLISGTSRTDIITGSSAGYFSILGYWRRPGTDRTSCLRGSSS